MCYTAFERNRTVRPRPQYCVFFQATVNYTTVFNITVARAARKSTGEFYRYTTCNIITTGHLPPMIEIQTAQQRKSHLAQLVFSILILSSST